MTRNIVFACAAFAPALLLVGCEHHGGKSPEERLTPVAEFSDDEAAGESGTTIAANEAAPVADTSGIEADPVTSELADLPADESVPADEPKASDKSKEKSKAKKPATTASTADTPMPQPEIAPPAAIPSDPSIDELINGTGAAAEPEEQEVAGWDDGLDDPQDE